MKVLPTLAWILVAAIIYVSLTPNVVNAAAVYMESGGDATQGIEFYDSSTTTNSGTVSSTSSESYTGPRSIDFFNNTTNSATAYVTKAGIMADAGRRISFRFKYNAAAALNGTCGIRVVTSGGALVASYLINTAAGSVSVANSTNSFNGGSISSGTWYRGSLSYTITNSTTHTFKGWLDGSQVGLTLTNSGTNNTSGVDLRIGLLFTPFTSSATAHHCYVDDVYVDDGTGVDDPGNIRVTNKVPATNNTGDFTSSFNVTAPSNRYENVDDRPIDTATGWTNTNTTTNSENYTLQSESAGDVNTTGSTYVARMAWVWAARLGTSGLSTTGTATGTCSVTANGNTGCTTNSMTFIPGQTVVCALGENPAGAGESISDSGGNTWNALTVGTSTVEFLGWYAVVGAGSKAGSHTVQFSATSGNIKRAGICAVFDGNDNSTPLDTNPAVATDGTSTYTGTASGTLAQANEVLIGIFAWAGPSTDTTACSTNTTTNAVTVGTATGGATSNATMRMCYDIKTATTTLSPNATNSTNRAGVQSTLSLKIRSNASPGVGTPQITNNGSSTNITLTTTPAIYTNVATSASYPSNAAGIGMVASGGTASTIWYEGGMLVAYIPATVSCTGSRSRNQADGLGRCSRQMSESDREAELASLEEVSR